MNLFKIIIQLFSVHLSGRMSTITNPLINRYNTFSPNLSNHNDKRNIKRARDELESLVAKCHNKIGVPAFAGFPIMDAKRGVVGLEIFAVNKSLKDFFENEALKTSLKEACELSMVEILEKAVNKINDDLTEANDEAGDDVRAVVQNDLAKPDKPIFAMNSKEMDSYFGQLKSSLAVRDDVKIVRKWAKKEGNEVLAPTKIPAFDEFVESVLPSNEYFGSSKKFARGKLHWRMQLVSAYLLTKYGYDFNSYAKVVPNDYVAKEWVMQDLIGMGDNPVEASNANKQKRKRKNRVLTLQDHVAVPTEVTADNDAVDDSEEKEDEVVAPADFLDEQEELNNSLRSENSLFSGSHASIDEHNADDDNEDVESDNEDNWPSQKNVIIEEMVEEDNDLVKFITKQSSREEFIYQVLDVKYVEKGQGYRAIFSDTKRQYRKVFFNSKLSPLVQKYLDNDGKFVIKVGQHRLFNNAVIIVDCFKLYWDPRKEILGNPEDITNAEVNEILANPDENYAASPSLFQAKVTTRMPGKLKKTRSVGK